MNGVLIAGKENQVIRAIYPGKIIFADWLPGYGLLLIIDHGEGYMSLYARNHVLNKNVGEQVAAGEPIARVGHTGGYEHSALYFEIRHDGKPENPIKWCHRIQPHIRHT